jgi:1-acyl-sn-glycerol-3-phosphate acyltransferase
MQYVRSKIFDVFIVAWTIFLCPSLPILWLSGPSTHYLRLISQVWVKGILVALRYIVGLRYVERGVDNIPSEPCIVVANHQSPWETFALAAKFPTAAFVIKEELARVPIVGWFLRNYPMIFVERNGGPSAIRKFIAASRATITEKRSIIIFPEGTRQSVFDKVEFKRGVEFLYADLRRPVLPIAVNSGVFWGPDRCFKYNGIITISYLPTIMPGLPRDEFKRAAESLIDAEKERLVGELDIEPWLSAIG